MIDHNLICVSDYQQSVKFYKSLFAPLGLHFCQEFEIPGPGPTDPPRKTEILPGNPMGGFGFYSPALYNAEKPAFWITQALHPPSTLHCAFDCQDQETVEQFHQAALDAGGGSILAPAPREDEFGRFFSAVVSDLDGNQLEAFCWL